MNTHIKSKIINNYMIELDVITGIITIDNIHIAQISDITIFDEYKDDIQTYEDKLNLFKHLVFKERFTITIEVRERTYFDSKAGLVVHAENDVFEIFELRFPLYSKNKEINDSNEEVTENNVKFW